MALLRVGMAELKIGGPDDVLQALGLGSCIGLALFDKVSHIGGMVHIMLPDSAIMLDGPPQLGKFADTGVPLLLEAVLKAGAKKTQLTVKLAGGAEMFAFAGKDAPKLSVGKRNIDAVHGYLAKADLRIDKESVGGTQGRTFEVNLGTLKCTIRIVGRPVEDI